MSVSYVCSHRSGGNLVLQDPSMAQIRQSLTEYAILPLGEPAIRPRIHKFATENGTKFPLSILL